MFSPEKSSWTGRCFGPTQHFPLMCIWHMLRLHSLHTHMSGKNTTRTVTLSHMLLLVVYHSPSSWLAESLWLYFNRLFLFYFCTSLSCIFYLFFKYSCRTGTYKVTYNIQCTKTEIGRFIVDVVIRNICASLKWKIISQQYYIRSHLFQKVHRMNDIKMHCKACALKS